MKPTWTKVYRGHRYPVDPKREAESMAVDPIYQCVMQEPNQDGRIDHLVHGVNRAERKRRQKELGKLFVKYGVTPNGQTAY